MNATQEFHFLTEVRWLCGSALCEAERLKRIAAEWERADRAAHELAAIQYTRLEQLRHQPRNREAFQDAMRVKQPLQAEFFAGVEAFLATQGRISLAFRPTKAPPGSARFGRGQILRTLFGIDEHNPLLNRDLRNRWQHFDESLDSIGVKPLHPQRFIHSDDYDVAVAKRTLRLLVVDVLEVEYLGTGRIGLRPLVAEITRLSNQLPEVMDSWGDRHADELDL